MHYLDLGSSGNLKFWGPPKRRPIIKIKWLLFLFFLLVSVLGPYPPVLRGYSWLWARYHFDILGGPFGMPGIRLGLAT